MQKNRYIFFISNIVLFVCKI